MSKITVTDQRRQYWLNAYLAMGEKRSLRALAAQGKQTDSSVPSERTLFRWSMTYGWDRQAKEHDRAVAHEARVAVLKEQVEQAQTRLKQRIQIAAALRAIASTAFTVDTPLLDEDGQPVADPYTNRPLTQKRQRRFDEFTPQELQALCALHRTAAESERLDFGEATQRLEASGTPGGDPIKTEHVQVLGPEALDELAVFFAASKN